eukprot:179815-Pyramimonas_sp.AAC.1
MHRGGVRHRGCCHHCRAGRSLSSGCTQYPAQALGAHASVREMRLDGDPQGRQSCWSRFGM